MKLFLLNKLISITHRQLRKSAIRFLFCTFTRLSFSFTVRVTKNFWSHDSRDAGKDYACINWLIHSYFQLNLPRLLSIHRGYAPRRYKADNAFAYQVFTGIIKTFK